MEISRENFGAMIFYDYKCNLSPEQCIDRLRLAFGNEVQISTNTVYNWFAQFQHGRTSLNDKSCESLSTSFVANIDSVRGMIERDRHMTYEEIRAFLRISKTSIRMILRDYLRVQKFCNCWIPDDLTEIQKQARIDWSKEMLEKFNGGQSNLLYNIVIGDETWIPLYEPASEQQSTVLVSQNQPKSTKVLSLSATKQMIAHFFGYTGYVATVTLENYTTVNSDWYTTICLPQVVNELRKTNQNHRIILYHDNARYHTTSQIVNFLSSNNIELITHCPHSPDLSPNDFFLFPHIKNKISGKRFESPEAALEAFRKLISEITALQWNKCFEYWFVRMQKCIDLNGAYFEDQ